MYPETTIQILQQLSKQVFPGVAFAYIKNQTVEKHHDGFAQLQPDTRLIKKDTLFDLASLTKMICTNSMILRLLETNEIELDTPLHFYLPEFVDNHVTIRHLLTHTSDINPYIPNRDSLKAPELKQALLTLASGNKIGEKMMYTDTGTILLGFLLEKLYNKDLHSLFQEHVLQPLGMVASCFQPSTDNIAATENHPQRGLICGTVHDPKASVLGKHCGSAGLFSDLDDCITFAQMMLRGGTTVYNKQFLQSKTVTALLSDYTPTKTFHRSLGWDLKYDQKDKHPMLFHTGYTGTFLLLDLQRNEAFVFLSNRVHPQDNRTDYIKQRDQLLTVFLNEKSRLE